MYLDATDGHKKRQQTTNYNAASEPNVVSKLL